MKAETGRLGERLNDSRAEADKAGKAADRARRLAGVHHREACRLRLRLRDAQAEYDRFDAKRVAATRRKKLWQAAVPLARIWEARGEASRLRDLLQAKLKVFAPDLEKLTAAATRFANALDHDLAAARRTGEVQRSEASRLREQTARAREEAAAAVDCSPIGWSLWSVSMHKCRMAAKSWLFPFPGGPLFVCRGI